MTTAVPTDFEMLKILPEPSVIVSAAGEIIYPAPRFLQLLSETAENLKGKTLAQISTDAPEKIDRYLQNCARSRQMVIGALNLQSAKGESLEYRCEGAVLERANGVQPAKIFLRLKPKDAGSGQFLILTQKIDELNREIRERRHAEEENHRLYLEAAEANRLKDEFLAIVSHELRTPLNSILGWLRMYRTHNLDQAQREKALATIERNALSQVQLIEDLLDVSRIITGKLRLDVQPVNIASVIESAVETVRPTADNKSVRLQTVLDSGVGSIAGDAERLQQAIWNLLSNAIKFTPKNGRVQVRLERINSHVEIIVSDTGAGIAQEFLPFVFDRFRQADTSKTRKFGGLGLGLAITRHLVELHGGAIHAFSEGAGRGATFTVRLPVNIVSDAAYFPDKSGQRAHPAAFEGAVSFETPSEIHNLKLLVVEDFADAREMIQIMLESRGAQVETAASAAEALGKLEKDCFDVLISDIEMPEEDGYSLIRKIRAAPHAAYCEMSAVALTAHTRVSDRLQILSAGFDFHIAKPFVPAELIAVIARLARRKTQKK